MRPFRPVAVPVGVVTSLGLVLPAGAAPPTSGNGGRSARTAADTAGADLGSVRALSRHVAGFMGATP